MSDSSREPDSLRPGRPCRGTEWLCGYVDPHFIAPSSSTSPTATASSTVRRGRLAGGCSSQHVLRRPTRAGAGPFMDTSLIKTHPTGVEVFVDATKRAGGEGCRRPPHDARGDDDIVCRSKPTGPKSVLVRS